MTIINDQPEQSSLHEVPSSGSFARESFVHAESEVQWPEPEIVFSSPYEYNCKPENSLDPAPAPAPAPMPLPQQPRKPDVMTVVTVVSILLFIFLLLTVSIVVIFSNFDIPDENGVSEKGALADRGDLEARLREILPNHTVEAMDNDPNHTSPQSKAMAFLLNHTITQEELENLQNWDAYRHVLQRFAMATIYYSTKGDSWKQNTYWVDIEIHDCDWFSSRGTNSFSEEFQTTIYDAKSCNLGEIMAPPLLGDDNVNNNTDGMINNLLLKFNNLSGSLPPELFDLLPFSQWIDLSHNALTGTIPFPTNRSLSPPGVSLLANLALFNNSLTGSISSNIGSLSKLQYLQLEQNQLSNHLPSELGLLTDLTGLFLDQNKFSGTIPSEIAKLTDLTDLWLHDNALEGGIPNDLGYLYKLQRLFLANNRLTQSIPSKELSELSNSLTDLDLSNNLLSGTLGTELGLLTRLEVLRISNNTLQGAIPSELGLLGAYGALQVLDLTGNALTGSISEDLCFIDTLLVDCDSLCGCQCSSCGDDNQNNATGVLAENATASSIENRELVFEGDVITVDDGAE